MERPFNLRYATVPPGDRIVDFLLSSQAAIAAD
jgi:hypothetical protein